MGGLARRVSYEKLFKKNLGQVPSLLVESGDFLTDERNAHGELRPDVSTKDEWIMKGYDQFPADVINISSRDLRYISRLLQKKRDGWQARDSTCMEAISVGQHHKQFA